jgi:putative transposase
LNSWEHALRWLWNLALEQRRMAYGRCEADRTYPSYQDQANELPELRAVAPWLEVVPYNLCQQVLIELDKAWQRCFNKTVRAPRWKCRGRDSVTLREPDKRSARVEGQTLLFHHTKLGPIQAVLHRPLGGKPKSVSITREGDQWFASVLCEIDVPDPVSNGKPDVGLDRGVRERIADSNGGFVHNERFLDQAEARLTAAQQKLSRTEKGSKNRAKARNRLNRRVRKVCRQRNHTLHVTSKHYAKNHGTVFVEDLKLKNMTASARGTVEEPGKNVAQKAGLNRAILDAGLGIFVVQLLYKCSLYGSAVEKVVAKDSSRECSACHHIAAESRNGALFRCVACHHQDHADTNAAKVVLYRGTHGRNVSRAVVPKKLRTARSKRGYSASARTGTSPGAYLEVGASGHSVHQKHRALAR